jgi:hypothetical protein
LAALTLQNTVASLSLPGSKQLRKIGVDMHGSFAAIKWLPYALMGWVFLSEIGTVIPGADAAETALSWMDEWRLARAIEETMSKTGCSPFEIQSAIQAIKIGIRHQSWYSLAGSESEKQLLRKWLSDSTIQDILWYNREAFGELLTWLQAIALVEGQKRLLASSTVAETLLGTHETMKKYKAMDKKSGYQVMKLIG